MQAYCSLFFLIRACKTALKPQRFEKRNLSVLLKYLFCFLNFFIVVFVFFVNIEYIESYKKNKDKFYLNYYLQKKERFLICNHIYYCNRKWTLRRWGKKKDQRWFKTTIHWWKYEAYLPVWEYITHCSTTNPIVCGNEDYDENTVKWYYDEHKECPWRMIYYAEWTAWPWDYCVISLWSCYNRSQLDCWFNWIKKRFEVKGQYDVAQYAWIYE